MSKNFGYKLKSDIPQIVNYQIQNDVIEICLSIIYYIFLGFLDLKYIHLFYYVFEKNIR